MLSGLQLQQGEAAQSEDPAGLDKRALACFPDIEKAPSPSSLILKAGVSIGKRLNKLDSQKTDLVKIIEKYNKSGFLLEDDSLCIQLLSLSDSVLLLNQAFY